MVFSYGSPSKLIEKGKIFILILHFPGKATLSQLPHYHRQEKRGNPSIHNSPSQIPPPLSLSLLSSLPSLDSVAHPIINHLQIPSTPSPLSFCDIHLAK